MKDKYYIFLDIDGVLWDFQYRVSAIKEGIIPKREILSSFNPKSIDALNNLIALTDKNFEPELVISSSWRENMFETKKILFENGLEYNKPINSTPWNLNPLFRGKEILEYLDYVGRTDNYVVIDDFSFDFSSTLIKENIIKTNIANGSLNNEHIKIFITHHPELLEEKGTANLAHCDFLNNFEENPPKQ